jgi:hypothetical protein
VNTIKKALLGVGRATSMDIGIQYQGAALPRSRRQQQQIWILNNCILKFIDINPKKQKTPWVGGAALEYIKDLFYNTGHPSKVEAGQQQVLRTVNFISNAKMRKISQRSKRKIGNLATIGNHPSQ